MAEPIEQLGTRSWEELVNLLDEGYFVQGEQRITQDSSPGALIPCYRL